MNTNPNFDFQDFSSLAFAGYQARGEMQEPPPSTYFHPPQPYPYHTPSYQEPHPYYEAYPPYHQPPPYHHPYFDHYQQPDPEPYYEPYSEPYYEPSPPSYLYQPPNTYHDPNPCSYTPDYTNQPTYDPTYPPQTPQALTSSSPCNDTEGIIRQQFYEILMEQKRMLLEMQEEIVNCKKDQEAFSSSIEDQTAPPTIPPFSNPLGSYPPQEVVESPSIGYHYVLEPSQPMGGDSMEVVEEDLNEDEVVYEEQPPPSEEEIVCAHASIEATAGVPSLVALATTPCEVEHVEILHYRLFFKFVPLGLKPFHLARHEYAILETNTQLLTICVKSPSVQVEPSWRLKYFYFGCLKALSEVCYSFSLTVGLIWDAQPRGGCCAAWSYYMIKIHGARFKKRIIFFGVIRLLWDPGGCLDYTLWW